MNRLHKAAGFLLVAIFFFQCQKDLNYIGDPDPGIPVVIAPDPIKAILQGNIVDENNQPAAGVSITVGAKTAVTDATGYFRITDASLDKNTSFVTAEKAGYFKGYRVFSATSGTNQVVIKLVKRNLAGTIQASSGGTATLANGAKISLPANAVVNVSSGAAYSGEVKVFASYINPNASDISETVPGSFMANNKDGKRVILSSFGMLAVELESSAGEKLQIKTGSAATLTSPIPSTALALAPAKIALWYVDEQTGIWKEEGTATKQGSNYVGDVKHFSFWNCDYPFDAVSLSVTLHTSDGLPLVYSAVRITATAIDTGGNSFAYGYTDSLGQVKGAVPTNKNLQLDVLDVCGNVAYTQNLSALTKNTDLGIIKVTGNNSFLTFTGTLTDCGGLPVKNGYAIITFDNMVRYAATDATGKFSTTLTICSGSSATAKVLGMDPAAQQQSTVSTITVTAPVTNAGTITACGTSSAQYINYTLDGTDYVLTSTANDSIIGYRADYGSTNVTSITGDQFLYGINKLSFSVNDVSAPGTFPVVKLSVRNYNNTTLTRPFNVTFTKFAQTSGEFYEGSFSGAYKDSTSTATHNINSSFRVMRIN